MACIGLTGLYHNDLGDNFGLSIFNCEGIRHTDETSNQDQLKMKKNAIKLIKL